VDAGGDDGGNPSGPASEEVPLFKDAVMARFQEGVAAFEKKDYPTAFNAFTSVSRTESRCDTCREYLVEIEERAELHFENGLGFFRKRNYARAIEEIEKARIPPLEPGATEYLFKSHFEIALKKFLQ
jgi:tetratricopeptide (TPR) repeat protein